MPLVKVNELLHHATENGYGVAAVNVFNYETIKWVAEAANRERIPVIIQFYPGFDKYIALKHVAAIAKDFAENSSVPIGVHLDHSAGYEIAVSGVRDGFPSVMVDGSALPYEENMALTAAVVKTAAVFGVDVEAELGHVGSGANLDDIVNSDLWRWLWAMLTVPTCKPRIWTLIVLLLCVALCPFRWYCMGVRIFLPSSCRRVCAWV